MYDHWASGMFCKENCIYQGVAQYFFLPSILHQSTFYTVPATVWLNILFLRPHTKFTSALNALFFVGISNSSTKFLETLVFGIQGQQANIAVHISGILRHLWSSQYSSSHFSWWSKDSKMGWNISVSQNSSEIDQFSLRQLIIEFHELTNIFIFLQFDDFTNHL